MSADRSQNRYLLATADRPQLPHTPPADRDPGAWVPHTGSVPPNNTQAYSHGAHIDELRKALDRGHAHRIDRARIGPLTALFQFATELPAAVLAFLTLPRPCSSHGTWSAAR
jgi:hypothetical protein